MFSTTVLRLICYRTAEFLNKLLLHQLKLRLINWFSPRLFIVRRTHLSVLVTHRKAKGGLHNLWMQQMTVAKRTLVKLDGM